MFFRSMFTREFALMRSKPTFYIVIVAVLSAVAYVFMLTLHFPILPLVPFLKVDFADIPVAVGSVVLGPLAGLLTAFVKCTLHLFQTDTAGVGELSNFICAAVFGLTASAVYNIKRNDTCLIIALVAAVLVEAGAAMLTNWFIIFPLYIAVGFDFVGAFKTGYVFFAGILPFNLIKFGIQAAAAFAVIKPLSHVPFIKINGSGQSAY